jgi:ribosome-associated protein
MEEPLQKTESPGLEAVKALCALLEDHKGADITALDLRELHSWTDYFIIATVASAAHRDGLLRHIKEFAGAEGFPLMRGPGKSPSTGAPSTGGWSLVDMGTVVIHLMSPDVRVFYELEELWSSAKTVYPAC